MKTHPTIIIAVDFTASSPHLLAEGVKLASANGGRLVAAHVIHEGHLENWVKLTGRKANVEARCADVTPLLQKLVDEHCAGIETKIDVRIGRPFKMLKQMIIDHKAELLIVGAHNMPNKHVGPVACRCARTVSSNVLILRNWKAKSFAKIAVCVNFQHASKTALKRAIDFARIHQASLEIIHVIYPPDQDPWGNTMEQPADKQIPYETMIRNRAAKRLDTFLKPFSKRLDAIEWSTLILESASPAAVIAAHVNALHIDLNVIGSNDSSWVENFVLGSTTERLLHDSKCSLLITRDQHLEGG